MSAAFNLFMQAVLGEDATTALQKAGERSAPLAAIIGPRTVVGWVNLASRWDYDGVVPGHDDSLLRFAKSESGLTGVIAMGESQLDFENAQPENLAAMICVGLGCPPDLLKAETATQVALAQLGETIDLMVKARVVRLLKAETPQCKSCHKFYSIKHEGSCCPHCSTELDKAELPGRQAKPIGQDAPEGQQAPTPTAPRRMASKGPQQVSMTKSMMERKCSVCESTQFTKSGEFKGCFCLRELGTFAKSEPKDDGCLVTFGSEWTKKNIELLLDIVGEKE
jgi:hypothetical protein